jgi:hypothetical protein
MFVNRGGGYSYRLCPKAAGALTEDCFRNHTLSFASELSWVQRGGDPFNRTAIRAHRTAVGTTPEGSVWTRNPVPPCANADGTPVVTPPACPQPTFELTDHTPWDPTTMGHGSHRMGPQHRPWLTPHGTPPPWPTAHTPPALPVPRHSQQRPLSAWHPCALQV